MKNGNIREAWELLGTAMILVQGCLMPLKFIKRLNGRFYARTKHEPDVDECACHAAPGGQQKKKRKKRIEERHLASSL